MVQLLVDRVGSHQCDPIFMDVQSQSEKKN